MERTATAASIPRTTEVMIWTDTGGRVTRPSAESSKVEGDGSARTKPCSAELRKVGRRTTVATRRFRPAVGKKPDGAWTAMYLLGGSKKLVVPEDILAESK
jgi:hypothetical protein